MTKKLLQVFLSLFYSVPCFLCQRHTFVSEVCGVCLHCIRKRIQKEKERNHSSICSICCAEHSQNSDPICENRNIFYESLETIQFRTEREKKLFQICKFGKQRILSKYFSLQTQGLPFAQWKIPDQIVLIPSEDKKSGRLFHPAGHLANRLSRKWNIPVLRILKKISLEKQSSKGFHERFLHSKKAWSFVPLNKIALGSQILLIDDVMTTGASLNEIARQLRVQGVSSVRCLVLLRSEEGVDGDTDQERYQDH